MKRKLCYLSVLVCLGVLALCGTAYSQGVQEWEMDDWSVVENGEVPTYAPDWWLDPSVLGEPNANMRIGWYDAWAMPSPAPEGIDVPLPDFAFVDFEPLDVYYPWRWVATGSPSYGDTVIEGTGIKLAKNKAPRQVDLGLPNRNLFEYKYFYHEVWFQFGNEQDRAWATGLGGMFGFDAKFTLLPPGPIALEVLHSGWELSDEGGIWAVYSYEAKMTPQADSDLLKWTIDTAGFQGDVYMTKVFAGSTCTPEPAAFVLLALSGLPIAYLRRRRKKT